MDGSYEKSGQQMFLKAPDVNEDVDVVPCVEVTEVILTWVTGQLELQ